VNDEIKQQADRFGGVDTDEYLFLCECSLPHCTEKLKLTLREYEQIRADSGRFVIAPGHAQRERDREGPEPLAS